MPRLQNMAPAAGSKRMKGTSIYRPFVYGSTARRFNDDFPRPDHVPADHTHSWTVFVKGVDNTDISYWLNKVQFKLHDSIENHIRNVDQLKPGETFETSATGWGEFEITIKFYFVPESNEKAQAFYHHLDLHPYGDEANQKQQRETNEVQSWRYDEMVWNEPYESFFEYMTTPMDRSKGGKGGMGKGTKMMGGGMVGSTGERTASIPYSARPGQPFSKETEREEAKKLRAAQEKVDQTTKDLQKKREGIEAKVAQVRKELVDQQARLAAMGG
ncbi:yeats family-domain-containing protein [Calycina marina]|uniref:Protein AF-9 homolog n=1 Tax=Calycina marina TaxID=1763456 RepID=A0A9P8CDW7_9HELO|nr:yeats family-domain-containing protein [Calycina marina]